MKRCIFGDLSKSTKLILSLIFSHLINLYIHSKFFMERQQQIELNLFVLNIQSIYIAVKFPCTLYLQHSGQILTRQSTSQTDTQRFIINQEVTIKWQKQLGSFQIVVHLKTDKGAKYLGGIIQLDPEQLIRQQGQTMVVGLIKAIDPNAYCQLRVDQINSQRVRRKVSVDMQKYAIDENLNMRSMKNRVQTEKNAESSNNNPRTKSQFQYRLNKKSSPERQEKARYSNANPHPMPAYSPKRDEVLSHQSSYLVRLQAQNRNKLIDAQVYKQSYRKLKQKYRRQCEIAKNQQARRIALQSNQNNLKIQLLRLKLKVEEYQKSIKEKTHKLKEWQQKVNDLQKRQKDASYLHEELQAKQSTIAMLEGNIDTINHQNQQLRKIQDISTAQFSQKLLNERNQFQKARRELDQKVQSLESRLKKALDGCNKLEIQVKYKAERIQKEQQAIDELENNAHIRLLQFESRINDCKTKLSKQKEQLQIEYKKLATQNKEQLKKIRELEQLVAEKQQYVIRISLQYDNAHKKIDQLNVEQEKYQIQKEELEKLNDHLQRQLKTTTKSFNEEQQKVQELNKQLKRDNQQKDDELNKLKTEILSLKSHIHEVQRQAKQYQQDLGHEKQLSHRLKCECESHLQQKDQESQKLKQVQTRISNLEAKNRQKDEQLTEWLRKEEEKNMRDLELKDSALNKAKNQIEKLQKNVESLQEQIKSIRRDKEQQERDWQLKSLKQEQTMEHLKQQLSGKNKDNQHLKNQLNHLEKQSKQNKKAYDALLDQSRNKELSFQNIQNQREIIQQREKMKEEELTKKHDDLKKLYEALGKENGELRHKIDRLDQEKLNLMAERNQLRSVHSSNSEKIKQLELSSQNLIEQIKNEKGVSKEREAENRKFQESINNVHRQNQTFKEEIDHLNKKIQRLHEENQMIHQHLKVIYEDSLSLTYSLHPEQSMSQSLGKNANNSVTDYLSNFKSLISVVRNREETINNNKKKSMESYGQQLKSVQQNLEKSQQSRNQLQQSNKALQNKLKEIKESAHKNSLDKKSLEHEVERMKWQIESIDGQNENLKMKIMQYEFQVNQMQKELISSRQLLKNKEQKEKQSKNREKQQKQAIKELNKTIKSLESEHRQMSANQQKQNRAKQVKKYEEDNQNLKSELHNFQSKALKIQNQYSALKEEYDQKRQELNQKEISLDQMMSKLGVLTGQLELQKNLNKSLKKQINDLQQDLHKEKLANKNDASEYITKQKETENKIKEKDKQIIRVQTISSQHQSQKGQLKQIIDDLRKQLKAKDDIIKELQMNKINIQKDIQFQKQLDLKQNEKLSMKVGEALDKVRQMEKSLQEYRERSQKQERQNKVLQQQINAVTNENKALQQKVTKITRQLQQKNQKIMSMHSVKEKTIIKSQEFEAILHDRNSQITQLKQDISALQEQIAHKDNQIQHAQRYSYSLQGDLCKIQQQYETKIQELKDQIEYRLEQKGREYSEKLGILQRDNQCYRAEIQELKFEREKDRKQAEQTQQSDQRLIKILEEKLHQEQNERKRIVHQKNAELKKQNLQAKEIFDALKAKQLIILRMEKEMKVAQTVITALESYKKATQDKIRNINKLYQSQLEALKKKKLAGHKNFKQIFSKLQWDLQRQIKAILEAFTSRTLMKTSCGKLQKFESILVDETTVVENDIVSLLHRKCKTKGEGYSESQSGIFSN